MSPMLMIASLAITAALVFYTIGVFAERRAGHLNGRHLAAAPRMTDTADDILTALSTPPPAH